MYPTSWLLGGAHDPLFEHRCQGGSARDNKNDLFSRGQGRLGGLLSVDLPQVSSHGLPRVERTHVFLDASQNAESGE